MNPKLTIKALICAASLMAAALVAGCGGGDQGRDPILGVPAADLVSIAVTPATASIAIGATQQLTAVAAYSDGSAVDVSTKAVWTSAAPATATVNAAGVATGASAGVVNVSAAFAGKSAGAALTVLPARLVSIALVPATVVLNIGNTQQYAVLGTFSDNSSRDISAAATFSVAAPAIATVSATGLATAKTAGATTVSAASAGLTASASLTVRPATVASLTLTPATTTFQVGATRQLVASATYTDGTVVNVTAASVYASATPAAVSINAAGIITAVAPGTSALSATFGGLSASASATTTAVTLTGIVVTPATATIAVGGSQQYVAVASYSDNTTAVITTSAAWTSSNTVVATVLNNGIATGLSAGGATITASAGGKSGSAALTVTATAPAPVVTLISLTLTPANTTFPVGATRQLVVTANYSNGTTADVSASSVFASSNPAAVSVSNTGLITGVGPGSSVLTATFGGLGANATATVSVNLRSAANFAVLAGTSLTNNAGGTTFITGDVGSPSQTTPPTQAPGYNNYQSGGILATALADLQLAITDANSRQCDVSSAGSIDLGGLVLTPGVYCYAGAISITGTFTMNGPGVYIFRTGLTLNTTANSNVALIGGATADDISWLPVGPTTLGADSVFKGSILGQSAAITAGANSTLLNGRVLSGAAVTLSNNQITK